LNRQPVMTLEEESPFNEIHTTGVSFNKEEGHLDKTSSPSKK